MVKSCNSPLRANIEGDELIIRVGINRIDGHDCHDSIPALKFENRNEWVEDVIAEIFHEEEDGSTPISNMIDNAMNAALENGSLGIAEDSFIFIGECPECGEDQVPLRHGKNGIECNKCADQPQRR